MFQDRIKSLRRVKASKLLANPKNYGMEIEPRYVDVSIRRWQNLTGKKAKLGRKTFDTIAKERGVDITEE